MAARICQVLPHVQYGAFDAATVDYGGIKVQDGSATLFDVDSDLS